jgi:hypothetical protein
MSRTEVAKVLNEPPRSITKEPGNPPVDQYGRSGVQAYFDELGRLEFVELTLEADVTFRGVPLLRRGLEAVVSDLKHLGLIGHDDSLGDIWFPEHGFAFYLGGDDIEAVSLYGREYADTNPIPPADGPIRKRRDTPE